MTVFDDLMNNGKALPERQLDGVPESEREQLRATQPNGIERRVHDEDIWGISQRAWKRTSELASKDLFSMLDFDKNNELSRTEIASGLERSNGSSKAGLKLIHESFDDIRGIGRPAAFSHPDSLSKDDIDTFVKIATMRIDAGHHRVNPKVGQSILQTETQKILSERAMPNSELGRQAMRVVGIGFAVNFLIGGWKQAVLSAPIYGAISAGTSYAAGRMAVNSRMNRLDVALRDWTNKIGTPVDSDSRALNPFDMPRGK